MRKHDGNTGELCERKRHTAAEFVFKLTFKTNKLYNKKLKVTSVQV